MHTLNVGVLAHVDAGKTTLTERLLFENGATSKLGSVDAGTTQTDANDLERERGITIRSAVASFVSGDLQINLIDTPGHPDFIAEVDRALSVLDAAVLVVSAVEGIQPQARVLMRSLRNISLPTLIFVNKIDRLGAADVSLLAAMRQWLAPHIISMTSVEQLGTTAARVVSRVLDDSDFRAQAAEILADSDDLLLARLVDGRVPSQDELQRLLVRQTSAGVLHPVFFGSALTGQGVAELTRGIRSHLPRPDKASMRQGGPRGSIFAIERGSNGEKVAYLRLFTGDLRERQRVTFFRREPNGGTSEFTGRIRGLEVVGHPGSASEGEVPPQSSPRADPSMHVESRLTAGGIAKLRGPAQVRVGDQLGETNWSGHPHFSPPSLESVIRPQQPGQEAKLHAALTSLADEDPLIRIRVVSGGATSVLLYGAVQREVIAARLHRDFAVDVLFDPIQPVYFERPTSLGQAEVEMDPRGSNTFWATIGLRVEPAEVGAGNSFVREVEWGSLPRAFHRAIEAAVSSTLQQGLSGWEVVDCKVTLTRVRYLAPVSVAADFRNLTPIVLLRALQAARTRVYEPCNALEVEAPTDTVGSILGYLTAMGADITHSSDHGPACMITGELPARLMQEFSSALPRLSRGEGAVWSQRGKDRPVRVPAPARERFDGNPLNSDEYLRFLSARNQ